MKDQDFVAPVGFMGAPVVLVERLPSGTESLSALRTLLDASSRLESLSNAALYLSVNDIVL